MVTSRLSLALTRHDKQIKRNNIDNILDDMVCNVDCSFDIAWLLFLLFWWLVSYRFFDVAKEGFWSFLGHECLMKNRPCRDWRSELSHTFVLFGTQSLRQSEREHSRTWAASLSFPKGKWNQLQVLEGYVRAGTWNKRFSHVCQGGGTLTTSSPSWHYFCDTKVIQSYSIIVHQIINNHEPIIHQFHHPFPYPILFSFGIQCLDHAKN